MPTPRPDWSATWTRALNAARRRLPGLRWHWALVIWLIWIGLNGIHAAWAVLRYPETFTIAYALVRGIAPLDVWAIVWAGIAVSALIAVAIGSARLAILALAVHATTAAVWSYSIADLVINGTAPGAWIGAGKWLDTALLSIIALGMVHDWIGTRSTDWARDHRLATR